MVTRICTTSRIHGFLIALLSSVFIISPISANLTITGTSISTGGALYNQLVSKLGTTIDQVFYAVASVPGPGIVNSAAYSSTLTVGRQQANLPRFQLEPAVGIILPAKQNSGDEKLNAMPLYSVNLVVGFRINEVTAIQARAFYLPSIALPVQGANISVQPYNFGLTFTRLVKKPGTAWYNPGIIAPLDFGYMHGAVSANFASKTKSFNFDPVGDGSASATGNVTFQDKFSLTWDVYTISTGLILVKPFWGIFTARTGFISTLNMGSTTLANTAEGTLTVSASTASGANAFKVGDSATLTDTTQANFRPVLVSNQATLGLGINLGPVALNLDVSHNVQINATAIMLQAGFWF